MRSGDMCFLRVTSAKSGLHRATPSKTIKNHPKAEVFGAVWARLLVLRVLGVFFFCSSDAGGRGRLVLEKKKSQREGA